VWDESGRAAFTELLPGRPRISGDRPGALVRAARRPRGVDAARGGGRRAARLHAALDSLRERGCTEATVWSFETNERANAFYEAHGFERDGAKQTEDAWAGLLQVRYRRSL
jgi:GNAT superfamily N-acetyltransferase